MSLSAVTSTLRRCSAAACIIAAMTAFGVVAVSTSGAIAQPSPPEPAAEATGTPDPKRDESGIGTGDSREAKPTGGGSSKAESAAPTNRAAPPASATVVEEKATSPGASDPAAASSTEAAASTPGTAAAIEAAKPAEPAAGEPEPAAPSSPTAAAPTEAVKVAKPTEPDMKRLKVTTWSGAYGEAQRAVVIERFKARQSVGIDIVERNGKDPIDLTTGAGHALPDAAEFSGREIEEGCRAGQLVKLEDGAANSIVAPVIASDFLAGSLKPCGIGAFAWSHVLAVSRQAFEKRKPETLSDAFDTKRFPGKRAFIKDPRFLMEVALMADGATPAEVYDLLASEDGLQRAFAKLASIRDDIVWVSDSRAAMDALAKGDAAIAQSFSGRAFFAAARGAPVDIIWDGQIYAITYWGIPAKSPRQKLARAFVEFAIAPQQLAAVAQRFPYGPTRTSALALTKRHLAAGLDLEAYLPTTPANLKTALSQDETWWAANDARLKVAFAAWLADPAATSQAPEKAE